VPALYLADTVATATAEGYRSLAEWGLSPQDHIPYDHHLWQLNVELADVSDEEQLHNVGLSAPRPSRNTWPAFQLIGEQLWHEGWAGLIAPSAAHPGSLITCVFTADWPPEGCTPLDASTVESIPPPPRGMTT
jgi:RES domain-containing protein